MRTSRILVLLLEIFSTVINSIGCSWHPKALLIHGEIDKLLKVLYYPFIYCFPSLEINLLVLEKYIFQKILDLQLPYLVLHPVSEPGVVGDCLSPFDAVNYEGNLSNWLIRVLLDSEGKAYQIWDFDGLFEIGKDGFLLMSEEEVFRKEFVLIFEDGEFHVMWLFAEHHNGDFVDKKAAGVDFFELLVII